MLLVNVESRGTRLFLGWYYPGMTYQHYGTNLTIYLGFARGRAIVETVDAHLCTSLRCPAARTLK